MTCDTVFPIFAIISFVAINFLRRYVASLCLSPSAQPNNFLRSENFGSGQNYVSMIVHYFRPTRGHIVDLQGQARGQKMIWVACYL